MKKRIKPILSYLNPETSKADILNDNRNKPGIYRWTNEINNKSYIGSSKCLNKRLNVYFLLNSLKKYLHRGRSAIYSAILKYGHYNFTLDILEHIDISMAIDIKEEKRIILSTEQDYLDQNSEYNICKIAGSRLGVKSSEKPKEKQGIISKDRKERDETKKKISISNLLYWKNNKRTPETIKKNKIGVFDQNHKLIEIFHNRMKIYKTYNIPKTTFYRYLKTGKLYNNKYYFNKMKNNN